MNMPLSATWKDSDSKALEELLLSSQLQSPSYVADSQTNGSSAVPRELLDKLSLNLMMRQNAVKVDLVPQVKSNYN